MRRLLVRARGRFGRGSLQRGIPGFGEVSRHRHFFLYAVLCYGGRSSSVHLGHKNGVYTWQFVPLLHDDDAVPIEMNSARCDWVGRILSAYSWA